MTPVYMEGKLELMAIPSQWRLDMIRRRAEEKAQKPTQRCIATKPAIPRAPHPKAVRKPRGPRKDRNPLPLCGCGGRMYHGATICYKCQEAMRNKDRVVCREEGCYSLLQRNNTLGKCLKHAKELRWDRANDRRKNKTK